MNEITANKKAGVRIEEIRSVISEIAEQYAIKKATLFGSRADGSNRENSDIDLILEFNRPVTLIFLSGLKLRLEERTGLSVDIIHGPIRESDMIEVGKVVELYAA